MANGHAAAPGIKSNVTLCGADAGTGGGTPDMRREPPAAAVIGRI